MAVETTTVRRVVPTSYVNIAWSGVIAGAAVAMALDALLAVLGGAVGASLFNPYAIGATQSHALTLGAGLWLVCANLLAFLIGGFVGVRTGVYAGHVAGMLQGLTVWAVALVASVFLASLAGLGAPAAATTSATDTGAAASDTASPTAADASATKSVAETVAWWTFATLGVGALAAVAGGRLGAEHLARRELALD
jgi:hypothetical protein